MSASFLLYGANGYTGALIAREAARRGLRPVLAGRNAEAVGALASELGLPHVAFDLGHAPLADAALADHRKGMAAVLHCAGPFAHTARAMADLCLRQRLHYLDITGEVSVFEELQRRDGEARAAGVMLLPGAGFDVVPSDCLASHLARRLPHASHLALAFQILGRPSRGTATTMIENLPHGGVVRRDGVLTRVPAAHRTRRIELRPGKPVTCMTIPWVDVSTAYHSTSIPNVEVYMAAPTALRLLARVSRVAGPLLGSAAVQGLLKRRVRAGAAGPSDDDRARGRSFLWGEATDPRGGTAVARLEGPEGYTMTVATTLLILQRVLAGQAPPGFQTPSRAYGADLILAVDGVARTDA